MSTRLTAALLALLGSGMTGCEPTEEAASGDTQAIDLPVQLEGGPAILRHEFQVANTTGRRREVVAVKPTCSCVSASITGRIIDPGESATLLISVSIEHPGHFAHGASVLYEDGASESYAITGQAETQSSFAAFPCGYSSDASWELACCAVLTTFDEATGDHRLEVLDSSNSRLVRQQWTTIEEVDSERGRPNRFLIRFWLKVDAPASINPIRTRILAQPFGFETTVTAFEAP